MIGEAWPVCTLVYVRVDGVSGHLAFGRTSFEREGVKKPKGVKIWTKQKRKLVGEFWIPCRQFSDQIRRPYSTVLEWFKKKWLPAIQFGTGNYHVTLTPWPRAGRVYRKLLTSGKLRAPRR